MLGHQSTTCKLQEGQLLQGNNAGEESMTQFQVNADSSKAIPFWAAHTSI